MHQPSPLCLTPSPEPVVQCHQNDWWYSQGAGVRAACGEGASHEGTQCGEEGSATCSQDRTTHCLKNVKNQPHFLLRVTRTPLNTQRNRQILLKVLTNAEAAKQLFVVVVSIRKGQFAVNKYEKVFFFKCLRYSFFPPVLVIFSYHLLLQLC